jgi:hypothetical protein
VLLPDDFLKGGWPDFFGKGALLGGSGCAEEV